MNTHFSENRMLAFRAAPRENNEAPRTMTEAAPESRTATRSWLRRNWGKVAAVLGLGLVAGTYGLGVAGQRGAFHDGGWFQRNMPTTLTTGTRVVSAQATRFTHLLDGGLKHVIPGIQTPTDANSAQQIRDNINAGTGPTRPEQIS